MKRVIDDARLGTISARRDKRRETWERRAWQALGFVLTCLISLMLGAYLAYWLVLR